MEFGSAFVLSKRIDPALDVEEIYEAAYSEGVRSEMKKNVRARGDNVCLLDILDTAGQEEYSSLRDQYTRSASSYLIVFSIADRSSFDEAQAIYAFCCRLRGSGTVPAVLCANKCDLSWERQVSTEDALRWANSQGIPMFETSAKQGTNIEEAFVKLVQVTPRTSHEYKIAVLGAGNVGKSSITVRFTQGHFVEEYDPTIEDSYRKQIVVPNLPPISQSARPTPSSSAPVSNIARRSSGFFSSLFRFGSSSTQVLPAAPPTPPATLPTYDEATTKTASGSRKVRRIPKADTNVLTLNLGSLAPENFDMLEVRALQLPPPSCTSCSAVMSASPTCLMCGKHNPDAAPGELEVRRAAEEYTLLKGSKSPMLQNDGKSPTVANLEDKGLVVFCIDISGSMSITQQVTQLQGMWNSFKLQQLQNNGTTSLNGTTQAPTYVSRLECMQDAMQVHLDRLETQFPERKVAVIAFDSELDCFVGGTRMPVMDANRFKRIHDAMDAARTVRPAQWKTVRENVGVLRDYVKGLDTKGATALGPALGVALGLAREHKRETGAATEIFLCTDGASNTGIGCTSSSYGQSADPSMHGRPFYAQAGEIALGQSAKINIIGIEGEGVALDVLSVAAQVSGGVVTMVKQDELRRQVRTASQRRVIAKDVTIKLYAAKAWQFTSDPRPGVIVDKNTLTYTLAQIDDETALGFAFAPPGGKGESAGDPRPFQAQVTYTSPSTGDTKVRVLNRLMPVTSDRTHAENAVEVALVGTYALQRIAFAANEVLVKSTSLTRANVKPEISRLRDELHAVHKMLIRGAKTNTQQEELGNFAHESAKLDQQLERMVDGSMHAADKDQAVGSLTRVAALSQNAVFSGSKKVGQVKRRALLK